MLKYASGEIPQVGDRVADGMRQSWKGTVIKVHGVDQSPLEPVDGISSGPIQAALIIQFDDLKNTVIEENPEEELVLINRPSTSG